MPSSPSSSKSSPSDEDAVRQALGGDAVAARALFDRWTPRLRSRVRRRLPSAMRGKVAESDVIQEAFLTAFQRMAEFEDRGQGSFGHWLGKILQNKIQDEVRRFLGTTKRDARREGVLAGSGLQALAASDDPSPSTAAADAEARQAVRDAVGLLSEPDRTVIRLVEELSLRFVDVGERLSCSEEAARKRYRRAVDRLRAALAAGGRPPRPSPDAVPPAPGDRVGPARLESLLGRGSMGVVSRGTLVRAVGGSPKGTPVAVKVLSAALAARPGFAARFRREASIGLRIRAPRVVRTIHVGIARVGGVSTPYIVSELVEGHTLRALLARDGAHDAAFCRSLAVDVAEALCAIHEAGAVHRDLKPENVLIDGQGRATLADLGLARLLDDTSGLTSSGTFVGSPRYAAPEQFTPRRARVDARSDLYALGLTLYESATGSHPFPEPNPWASARRRASESPPRVRDARPGFDPRLDHVIARLMEPTPSDRFASATELLGALRGC